MAATAAQATSLSRPASRFLRLPTAKTPDLPIPTRAVAPRHGARLRCHLSHSNGSSSTPTTTSTTSDPDPDAHAPLRVAFACGGAGAGGRVYTAIALADELHASLPSSRSLILGAPSPSLESTAAAAASYPFAPLPRCLPRAVLAAALHLRRFRPHVLVATGGAPALSTCLAALLLGLPFVIQDQDTAPAPATRLLRPPRLPRLQRPRAPPPQAQVRCLRESRPRVHPQVSGVQGRGLGAVLPEGGFGSRRGGTGCANAWGERRVRRSSMSRCSTCITRCSGIGRTGTLYGRRGQRASPRWRASSGAIAGCFLPHFA